MKKRHLKIKWKVSSFWEPFFATLIICFVCIIPYMRTLNSFNTIELYQHVYARSSLMLILIGVWPLAKRCDAMKTTIFSGNYCILQKALISGTVAVLCGEACVIAVFEFISSSGQNGDYLHIPVWGFIIDKNGAAAYFILQIIFEGLRILFWGTVSYAINTIAGVSYNLISAIPVLLYYLFITATSGIKTEWLNFYSIYSAVCFPHNPYISLLYSAGFFILCICIFQLLDYFLYTKARSESATDQQRHLTSFHKHISILALLSLVLALYAYIEYPLKAACPDNLGLSPWLFPLFSTDMKYMIYLYAAFIFFCELFPSQPVNLTSNNLHIRGILRILIVSFTFTILCFFISLVPLVGNIEWTLGWGHGILFFYENPGLSKNIILGAAMVKTYSAIIATIASLYLLWQVLFFIELLITMLSNLGQHELGVILVYGLMFFSYYAADYDWKYISLLAPMSWASLPISSAVQSQWKLLLYPMALISLLNIALVLCNLLCCNRPIQKETL